MGRTVPLRRIQLFELQGAPRRRHKTGEQPTGEHQRGRRQHLDERIQRHNLAIQQAHDENRQSADAELRGAEGTVAPRRRHCCEDGRRKGRSGESGPGIGQHLGKSGVRHKGRGSEENRGWQQRHPMDSHFARRMAVCHRQRKAETSIRRHGMSGHDRKQGEKRVLLFGRTLHDIWRRTPHEGEVAHAGGSQFSGVPARWEDDFRHAGRRNIYNR